MCRSNTNSAPLVFTRSLRLLGLLAMLSLLPAGHSFAVNRGSGQSGDSSQSTNDKQDFKNDNGGKSGEPGDHKESNCSVVYSMNIGSFQSEFGSDPVEITLKRLKPTPAMFTPQSLEVTSPFAADIVQLPPAEEALTLQSAQTAYNSAEQSLAAATVALNDAEAAEAHASTELTAAQQTLADAEAALAADPDNETLQAEVADADADVAAKEAALSAAQSALATAEATFAAAQSAKNSAEATLATAQSEFDAFVSAQQASGTLLENAGGAPLSGLTLVRPNGKLINYRPDTLSGRWKPDGSQVAYSSRLQPRSAREVARVDGKGNAFVYSVDDGARPVYTTRTGRSLSAQSAGVRQEIIRREDALRQVLTAQTLSDVVVLGDHGYETRLYHVDQKGTKNAEGLYEPTGQPFASFRVENPTGNPNRTDLVRITTIKGGRTEVAEWQYTEGVNAWALIDGEEAERIRTDKTIQELPGEEIHEWKVYNADDTLVSHRRETITKFPWGKWMTRQVLDPDGANRVLTREFYTNASQNGKYGKLKTEVKPDGSWVTMDYDSEGREILRIEPWLDAAPGTPAAQAKATYFDHTPLDPNDSPLEYDLRPRTETVKIHGDITKKTFFAYFKNASGEFVEIEEKAATPTAAYGDAANLRRTKTHYAETEDEDIAGRLKTEAHPDGRLDTYTYERLADNTFITTVTHGVIEAPAGVANKTTRVVTTLDPEGNETRKETHVYTGGTTYELIETIEKDFNGRGQITERRRNGRILYTATYVDGLRTTKTDEQGITTTYTHDVHERVATETKVGVAGQADIVTTYTYDGENRILKKEVEGGSLVEEWTYDLAGRITSYRDQNAYLTTYLYENDGRKVTRTNPDTGIVVTERFRDGRLKSVSGSGTVDEYYAYTVNADGSLTTDKTIGRIDSLRVLSTTKDILDRTVERRRPGFAGGDFVIEYEYDDEGYLVKQTETEKADTLFVYNSARQLHRRGLDLNANGLLDLASDDRISETDESFHEDLSGNWWRSSKELIYDASGVAIPTFVKEARRRISGHAAGEASETIIIDTRGNETNILAMIDRSTATMTVTTDVPDSSLDAVDTHVNGLLQSRTTSTVAEPTLFTYEPLGRLRTVKQPRHSQRSVINYEAGRNRIESETDPDLNRTSYWYYAQGEKGAGRIRVVENADRKTVQVADDLFVLVGKQTRYEYDLLGKKTRTWGEATYPVEFVYNEFGEQVTMTTYRSGDDQNLWTQSEWPATPPAGDTTTWTYDEATGLLAGKTDASGEAVTYDYTTAGRMSDRYWARLDTQSNPLQTTYAYNPLTGERTAVDYADSTPDITYTHDRMGRLDTVVDATGSRSFDYADDLQLSDETIASFYGTDKRITRTYETGTPGTNVVGRYTGFQVGSAADTDADYAVTYGFDTHGWLDSVADLNQTFAYGYLADSNLLETMTSPVHSTTYTYEDERNVKTVVDNVVNLTSTSKYSYAYDELGRRTSRVQEGSAFVQDSFDAFEYNDRSEVIDSKRYLGTNVTDTSSPVVSDAFAYEFDPIGNRIESSTGILPVTDYTTNELNQYATISGVSTAPDHDEDGNLTEQGDWVYKWNAENRLIEAYSFAEDQKLEFVYDYLGRRVEKKVTQISTTTLTSEERFLYDGWNLVAVYEPANAGTLVKTHTWGLDLSQTLQGAGAVGGLLGVEEMAGTHQGVYAFAYDVNGNVSEVFDDAGAVVAHYEYSPFGEVVRSTGSYADANPFRFSSKYLDTETGFYYYGYRHYDPATGRWLSKDPLQEEGGLNLYAFVTNKTLNLFDLLGLSSVCYGIDPDTGEMVPGGEPFELTDFTVVDEFPTPPETIREFWNEWEHLSPNERWDRRSEYWQQRGLTLYLDEARRARNQAVDLLQGGVTIGIGVGVVMTAPISTPLGAFALVGGVTTINWGITQGIHGMTSDGQASMDFMGFGPTNEVEAFLNDSQAGSILDNVSQVNTAVDTVSNVFDVLGN